MIAGARLAGELIAAPAGFSTAALFDPETGEEMTVLGRLYGWIALAVFLTLDGPLILVRALVESYQAVPAGRLLISWTTVAMAFAQVGSALALRSELRRPRAGSDPGRSRHGLVEPRGPFAAFVALACRSAAWSVLF